MPHHRNAASQARTRCTHLERSPGPVDLHDAESVRRSGNLCAANVLGSGQRPASRAPLLHNRLEHARHPVRDDARGHCIQRNPHHRGHDIPVSDARRRGRIGAGAIPRSATESCSGARLIDVAHPLCPRFRAPVSPSLHAWSGRQGDDGAHDDAPAQRSASLHRADHPPLPTGTSPRLRAHPPLPAPRPRAARPALLQPVGKLKNNSVRTLPIRTTG
jgi:hypothetical protein